MMGRKPYTPSGNQDLTMDRAKLGLEAEGFLRSSLGRYLVERAEAEIEKGFTELFKVSPSDTGGNIEARMDIQVPMNVIKWLNEAVDSGKLAMQELQEEDLNNY